MIRTILLQQWVLLPLWLLILPATTTSTTAIIISPKLLLGSNEIIYINCLEKDEAWYEFVIIIIILNTSNSQWNYKETIVNISKDSRNYVIPTQNNLCTIIYFSWLANLETHLPFSCFRGFPKDFSEKLKQKKKPPRQVIKRKHSILKCLLLT